MKTKKKSTSPAIRKITDGMSNLEQIIRVINILQSNTTIIKNTFKIKLSKEVLLLTKDNKLNPPTARNKLILKDSMKRLYHLIANTIENLNNCPIMKEPRKE